MVGEALRRLEAEKKISLEDIQKDETFIDTVMHASQAAMRSSHDEKRRALLNGILNSALPDPPDESLRQVLVNLVDTLTVWHIRILSLFHGPEAWAAKRGLTFPDLSMGGLSAVIENCFPELRGRRDFYDTVWRDLFTRGLVSTESVHGMMTGQGLRAKRTTDLGDRFLRFIQEPE